VQKVRLYDESAPTYHRRYRQIQGIKYQAIAPFLLEGPIIDVGFGTGIGLASIIKHSPVVGIDGSIEMLRFAAEQLKEMKQGSQMVSLVYALAEALPVRDCSVPSVVSVTMIQNLTSVIQGIDELRRIVQKDGRLALTSLSKILPLKELESKIKINFTVITHFENLAAEDDGLIFRPS
jgi:ubiquinone/menaquinone biosynthesis C-methylase UbiE